MEIFVFSSSNLTNIWAGVGARTWAVSQKLAKSKGTITKSKNMLIGSLGLLYSSQTQELTTPFLTTSIPVETLVADIWEEKWGLPFGIAPLGSPKKRIGKDILSKELPSVSKLKKAWNKVLMSSQTFRSRRQQS